MGMKVLLVAGGVAGVAGLLIAMKSRSEVPREMMAQKMRQRFESMPEDFPPRVMFDNLAATRANTERILEVLGERDAATSDDTAIADDPEPDAAS